MKRHIIEQPDMTAIKLVLGNHAQISQAGDYVFLRPEPALELSYKLAAWAVARLAKADTP